LARIIEAPARITAVDATGAFFDKIAKKIEGIAKSAKSSAEVDKLTTALAGRSNMAAIDRFRAAKTPFVLRPTSSATASDLSKVAVAAYWIKSLVPRGGRARHSGSPALRRPSINI
jgi:hypothetical protein